MGASGCFVNYVDLGYLLNALGILSCYYDFSLIMSPVGSY